MWRYAKFGLSEHNGCLPGCISISLGVIPMLSQVDKSQPDTFLLDLIDTMIGLLFTAALSFVICLPLWTSCHKGFCMVLDIWSIVRYWLFRGQWVLLFLRFSAVQCEYLCSLAYIEFLNWDFCWSRSNDSDFPKFYVHLGIMSSPLESFEFTGSELCAEHYPNLSTYIKVFKLDNDPFWYFCSVCVWYHSTMLHRRFSRLIKCAGWIFLCQPLFFAFAEKFPPVSRVVSST